jgi:hypothetical protein
MGVECEEKGVHVLDKTGWKEELVNMEDGKGIVGWFDPEQCLMDFTVVVGSWGDWGLAKCWQQLGLGSLFLVAFTEKAMHVGRAIWGTGVMMNCSKEFLSSYRNDCDIYTSHYHL